MGICLAGKVLGGLIGGYLAEGVAGEGMLVFVLWAWVKEKVGLVYAEDEVRNDFLNRMPFSNSFVFQ
jgi:hypothetical protein